MDDQVDIRGFLEVHVWILYGFSDQGRKLCSAKKVVVFAQQVGRKSDQRMNRA